MLLIERLRIKSGGTILVGAGTSARDVGGRDAKFQLQVNRWKFVCIVDY